MLQVRSVVSLASLLMMGFGVMFQLPIVVFLLAITGIVEVEAMRKARPVVVIIVFVASALLTPPDIISQCAMGIPSMLLFEISLVVSSIAVKRKRAREAAEEARERNGVESAHEPPDEHDDDGGGGGATPGDDDDGSAGAATVTETEHYQAPAADRDTDHQDDDSDYEDWSGWPDYGYENREREKGGRKVRSKLRIRARSNTLNTRPRARARRNMLTNRNGTRNRRPGSPP
jgi:hypothetical protein